MTAADRARAMFPLMPAEVFDEWLGRLIAAQGWPFMSTHDSIYVHNWAGMLLDMPLTEWADVTWSKCALDKDAMRIVPESVKLVMDVAVHFLSAAGTDVGRDIRGSRERSRVARELIESTGEFPGFITALRYSDGRLQLVDGHHPELFTFEKGDKKGQQGVTIKGRLLKIKFAKVNGVAVDLPQSVQSSEEERVAA